MAERLPLLSLEFSSLFDRNFLPLGLDPDRPDVVIGNTTSFRELIQTYKLDPCRRLVRNPANGRYDLDSSFFVEQDQTNYELHAHEARPCPAKYPKAPEPESGARKKGKQGQLRPLPKEAIV